MREPFWATITASVVVLIVSMSLTDASFVMGTITGLNKSESLKRDLLFWRRAPSDKPLSPVIFGKYIRLDNILY